MKSWETLEIENLQNPKSKWTIHIYKVWSEEFGTQERFSKLGYWREIYLKVYNSKDNGKSVFTKS